MLLPIILAAIGLVLGGIGIGFGIWNIVIYVTHLCKSNDGDNSGHDGGDC